MKRLTAILLATLMLVSVGTFSPVAAAEGEMLKQGYTFFDTCYSPELGVYVAIAKQGGTATEPGEIFYSTDGDLWKSARTVSSIKHYAVPKTRQSVVWWAAEKKFVLVANTNVLSSPDGVTWNVENGFSGASPKGRSNCIVTTDGEQLLLAAGKNIRILDNFTDEPVSFEYSTGAEIFAKTAAIADTDPRRYIILDTDTEWYIDSKDQIQTGTVKKGSMPLDMALAPTLNGWLVINETTTLRLFDKNDMSYTTLDNIALDDGTSNTQKLTAAAATMDYVTVGTQNGELYVAPAVQESFDKNAKWSIMVPGDRTEKITKEVRSITAIDDGFYFATENSLYMAALSDEGWKYYEVFNSYIDLEGEERIEIPAAGESTYEYTAQSINWKGEPSSNVITSVKIVGSLPEGIRSETTNNSIKLIVGSEAKKGRFDIESTAANGQKKRMTVTVAGEERVDISGADEMVIPQEGDTVLQYEYSAVVVGTDGKPMTTRQTDISVDETTVPSGVTVTKAGESTIRITVNPSAEKAEITLNAVSKANPSNTAQRKIMLSARRVSRAEIVSGEISIEIPDKDKVNAQYAARFYDQTGMEILKEECLWSMFPSIEGVVLNADTGEVTVPSRAYDGTTVLRASSKSDSTVFAELTVTFTYTDLRKLEEDTKALDIDTSAPLEQGTVLLLPTEGKYGSKITWKSSDEALLRLLNDTDGLFGVVISPTREDKKVTLTASVSLNNKSNKKTFDLIIKKADTLCTNGDFADGTYNGWEKKSEQTTRAILKENGKNVLQVVGDGVYQILNFTNDSSYGFEAKVKAEKGNTVRLISQTGGTIATLTADGTYRDMKGSLDFRKMNNSFEDKIYLESDGVLTIDGLKVYEITLELDAVTAAVNKAVYSKKKEDITRARTLLADFYDLPVKNELEDKLDGIDTSSGGNSSSGSAGGGGSKAPSSVGGGSVASSAPALPEKAEDNYSDELDTFLLNFKDMKYHWAREDVEYMAGLNLVSGKETGVFAPEDNISRAEFAVLITRVMGLTETEYENSFYDVVSGDWYSGYVQTVKSNNFMNGYDGLFRPEAAISREEIAKVIVEAYNSKTNGKIEKGGALYFNDLADISYWAYDYIVNAVNLGFVNGVSEDIFAPQNYATRAEAAVMLRRVYDKLHAEK